MVLCPIFSRTPIIRSPSGVTNHSRNIGRFSNREITSVLEVNWEALSYVHSIFGREPALSLVLRLIACRRCKIGLARGVVCRFVHHAGLVSYRSWRRMQ